VGGRWLLGKCQELGLGSRQQQYFPFEVGKGWEALMITFPPCIIMSMCEGVRIDDELLGGWVDHEEAK